MMEFGRAATEAEETESPRAADGVASIAATAATVRCQIKMRLAVIFAKFGATERSTLFATTSRGC